MSRVSCGGHARTISFSCLHDYRSLVTIERCENPHVPFPRCFSWERFFSALFSFPQRLPTSCAEGSMNVTSKYRRLKRILPHLNENFRRSAKKNKVSKIR